MQYLSGYFWRQEESVSLVLKHLVYPGESEPVLFGCLCQGEDSVRFCKKLTDWFYREGLHFCKKTSITPESLQAQLQGYLRSCMESQVMGAVLLCVGEYFALWSSLGQQIHLLNTRFGKSHVRLLTDGKEEQFLCGKFQKGVAILLSAQGISAHMREEELAECLAVKDLVSEERLEKRLREISAEALRRGEEQVSTMLVMTC